jgi:predicted Rossmann-fold nucleotide-binding protein
MAAMELSSICVYCGSSMGTDPDFEVAARETGELIARNGTGEIDHPGLTELIVVGSMHERKQRMFELADAFVALPGGLGTLEELAEMATWSQLALHRKPIATLDVNGYWAGLHAFLRASAEAGLLKQQYLGLIVNVTSGPGGLLPALRSYAAPPVAKWIEPVDG